MGLRAARRRSPCGWVGLFSTLLALGLYVAFDPLDLDGLDLCARLFRNAITADLSLTEAESFFAHDPLSSEGLGSPALPPTPLSVLAPAKVPPRMAPATRIAGSNQLPLRAQARRGLSSTTSISPTEEPT